MRRRGTKGNINEYKCPEAEMSLACSSLSKKSSLALFSKRFSVLFQNPYTLELWEWLIQRKGSKTTCWMSKWKTVWMKTEQYLGTGHWWMEVKHYQSANRRGKTAWAFKMRKLLNSHICLWLASLLCLYFMVPTSLMLFTWLHRPCVFPTNILLIKKVISSFSWMGNNANIWQLHFIGLFIDVKLLGSFISKYILDWWLNQNQIIAQLATDTF